MSAKVRLLLSLLALLVGNAVSAPLDESEATPDSSSQNQAGTPAPDQPTVPSPPAAPTPPSARPNGTGGDCPLVCRDPFPVPVCGSDGRIYHSECVMKQLTCR
ncbi:unnamed protein product, partial [Ixodes hexagonus]